MYDDTLVFVVRTASTSAKHTDHIVVVNFCDIEVVLSVKGGILAYDADSVEHCVISSGERILNSPG